MGFKRMIQGGIKYLTNSDYRFLYECGRGKYESMPDKEYLSRCYKAIFGKELNLQNPITFSEKLQWLKLYDRNPLYTIMVDKYLVRNYISSKIGEEYLIPLLGSWDTPDEIDFSTLPDQFVLKCNHNSGTGMYICKNKKMMDIERVRYDLLRGLNENYYMTGREWPYKDVPRKIICEKFMTEQRDEIDQHCSDSGLKDYKFFCFNGKVRFFKIDFDRFTDHHANYYDINKNILPFGEEAFPPNPNTII